MIDAAELAERMKVEIIADVKAGIVPPSAKTFAELHDFVDANCYGGTEALLDEFSEAAGGTEQIRQHALDALIDLMNPAIEIVNSWLGEGGIATGLPELESPDSPTSVIPQISDARAHAANQTAIDRFVHTDRFHHIIAWGKWLGFTPQTVLKAVKDAEADDAPWDAIQKIDGRWLRLDDITNEENRRQVEEIAQLKETDAPQP